MNYYLLFEGAKTPQGPFTADEIIEAHKTGGADDLTRVAQDGGTSWRPLGYVIGGLHEEIRERQRAEAARQRQAAAAAALAQVPECPICKAKDWRNAKEMNGGQFLVGCGAIWMIGVPMLFIGALVSAVAKSPAPFWISFGVVVFFWIMGNKKRLFRQCAKCKYRYQIG